MLFEQESILEVIRLYVLYDSMHPKNAKAADAAEKRVAPSNVNLLKSKLTLPVSPNLEGLLYDLNWFLQYVK